MSPGANDTIEAAIQGWGSQPNQRGTLDIIWPCVATIFLCVWTVLCVNVPAPDDSQPQILARKASLAGPGIIGPEIIFQLALAQWYSARRALKAFHNSGHKRWTMNHAFFADMGGFVLHTLDFPPFPINALQLYCLVSKKHLTLPHITRK